MPTSVRALSITEAKQYLRRISLWIGLAGTVLLLIWPVRPDDSWPGQSYESAVPLSFLPLAIGAFVAAVRTGGRDRAAKPAGLAQEAPLAEGRRTEARLVGLIVPVMLSILTVIGIAVVSRIEGGFWIGEDPRRTDSALHSIVELLQPPLIIAMAGAAGVAIGRALPRIWPSVIVGSAVWFMAFGFYWAWNNAGLHAFAPAQVQPLRIKLPVDTDPHLLPTSWFVDGPGPYTGTERQWVHLPTVVWHNVYLLGVTFVWGGLAIRGTRGQRIVTAGLGVAIAGAAVQLIVSPF